LNKQVRNRDSTPSTLKRMYRLIVVLLLLAGPAVANQRVYFSNDTLPVILNDHNDTLHCDPSVHVDKTFCPHCEAFNDFFSPDFTGKIPVEFRMSIFDKDGIEIFSSENIDKGWNGLNKESDEQMSEFTWKMVYRYEKNGPLYECSGKLALIQ
jgi:hypothetical protein